MLIEDIGKTLMYNRVNVLCKYLSDICDVIFAIRVKVVGQVLLKYLILMI